MRSCVSGRLRLLALALALAGKAQADEAVATHPPKSNDDAAPVVAAIDVTGHAARGGPTVSVTGANDYGATASDIANLPLGGASDLTDLLTQFPGVAIDQNQQIHIRDTEGPQFQYQINGALVPLDINTNPPFLSQINPMFIEKLDLIDGILPARYGFATGGVVSIDTKDGCAHPGGSVSVVAGQRETFEPSAQYGGCAGQASYYLSGLYDQGQTAFSSATPGPAPVHDRTHAGQFFGIVTAPVAADTKLSLILSAASSNNQLPNVPGLAPQFTLAGAGPANSADINSYLKFRDYLGILLLNGAISPAVTYQLAWSVHAITQDFRPDDARELIFQGVASTASHRDFDNTLQGDVAWAAGRHDITAGAYVGLYHVVATDSSLVFPADDDGNQLATTPIRVSSDTRADNVVVGLYVNDLWRVTDRLKANLGLRWDSLTGFTNHSQFDPTFNLSYELDDATAVHGGVARYMQVPSFQGIAPNAGLAFAGTTGATGVLGVANPLTEDDLEFDGGVVRRFGSHITLSADGFYERTNHYLDTGQFGVVPIFAPFNYGRGYIWGAEFAARYRDGAGSAYVNLTLGRNIQKGVDTGQFNFDPDELAYIDSHPIVLDHQPLVGVSFGANRSFGPWTVSLDGVYSSGLTGGFADLVALPQVLQINGSVERSFRIAGVGRVTDRITVLNLADRTNLIRPAEGIGIFQSAYGPRLTVLDTLTLSF
jgi:hypothetical protein